MKIKQFIIVLAVFSFLLSPILSIADNIDSTNKYSWGENIGWMNWAPIYDSTEYGVTVYDECLTGYIWTENAGWIKVGDMSCSGGDCCQAGTTKGYENDSNSTDNDGDGVTDDWGVNNDGSGNLSGYAWGENAGWINFDDTSVNDYNQVVINGDGEFTDYAWGENVGWVNMNCANDSSCGTVDFAVETSWSSNTAPTVDSIDISPSPINLNADTTKTVTITATITDNNGCEDVFTDGSIVGVFFDDVTENDTCTQDDNDCYASLTLTEVENTCTGAGDYTANASVDVPVWFIANPSSSWTAKVTATDEAAASDSDTQTVTINTLIAFKLDGASIPYGTVDPNQVSAQQAVLITTTGNAPVDAKLSGIDITWGEHIIDMEQQKYSSASDFNWEAAGTALTGTATCHELSTGKPTAHPSNQSESVYWKLKVPLGKLAGGPYTGTNTFDVVSETTCP
jgi:hypothetical protein